MAFPPPYLVTERLVLRLPTRLDAASVFEEYGRDPEVARYMTWRRHHDVTEAQAFLAHCEQVWSQGSGEYAWVIETKDQTPLIGMIGVLPSANGIRLGYVFARDSWGKGYATEAVTAVVECAFRDPEIHRVWAFCDVDNVPSARVLEKSGMQFEGVLRAFSVHPNIAPEPRDCRCYARVR